MEHYLKIAEMAVGEAGDTIRTVLGSCIGLCLRDRKVKRAAMVHIMMPSGGKPDEPAGKYADQAVPALVERMESAGSQRKNLVAKITGGASMFGHKSTTRDDPLAIGDRNRQEVLDGLKILKIPLEAEETGGTAGRNVTLDCETGTLTIRRQDGTSSIL